MDILFDEYDGVCTDMIDVETYIDDNLKAFFSILGAVSICASVFVTISIFTVPKLRSHPNGMIGFISLFEGIACFHTVVWSINSMSYIQFFGLQKLMQYTFIAPPMMSEEEACKSLCSINRIIGSLFFSLMSLGMNTWLCIDLYLTLKQPFYPAGRRLKYYLLFSFLFSASIVTVLAIYSSANAGILEQ